MARATILDSNVTISDYAMLHIVDCMQDYLRKRVARACPACSIEWVITEYTRRLSIDERDVFATTLLYTFGLNLSDIAYNAYLDRYGNKLISYERLIWLETACPFVLKVEHICGMAKYSNSKAYVVSMISGDFTVYAREEEEQ